MDVQRFYEIYLRIYIKEAYIYVWRRTYDERAFFFYDARINDEDNSLNLSCLLDSPLAIPY